MKKYFEQIMIGWTAVVIAVVAVIATFLLANILTVRFSDNNAETESVDVVSESAVGVTASAIATPNYNAFVVDEELQEDTSLDDIPAGTIEPVATRVPTVMATKKPTATKKPKRTQKPKRTPRPTKEPRNTIQTPAPTPVPTIAPTEVPVVPTEVPAEPPVTDVPVEGNSYHSSAQN